MKNSTHIRWGIIGTGMIAHQFAVGLQTLPDAQLLAVSSRREESAQYYANQFNVSRSYIGHHKLLQDSDIDVVYIGTPHTTHKQIALDCIEAGKAVLIEKPFTLNASEARSVINKAREKGVFCMEAMWMRFIPLMQIVKKAISEKVLGNNLMLNATMGFKSPYDPQNRFFNLELGGGALLDLGIYPINLAFWLLGAPDTIKSYSRIGETGVDEMDTIIFGYNNGSLASLSASNTAHSFNQAFIQGELGRLHIYEPIYSPTRMKLELINNQVPQSTVRQKASQIEWLRKIYRRARSFTSRFHDSAIHIPFEGNGYNYEAAEVQRCLRNGNLESNVMPLAETLNIMTVMDEIREQWNLQYPNEK